MRALRAAIKDKQFSPAYYLHGEEEFLKEEALRQLIAAAIDPATRDFNLDQRKGADLDAESLASLLGMPPMMAERRVVVIRDVGSLKKDARAALDRYLRSPASDLLLALTAPADEKSDKALSSLAEPLEFKPLTGVQTPKWIAQRVERDLGSKISAGAIDLLQDAVGSDLTQLAIELDKLVAYAGAKEIDESAVSAVVGVRREETMGQLLDAVAARNGPLALSLVPGVLQQPKTTAVQVVMALTTQTLALGIGHARGIRNIGEYFALLKNGGPYTGRSWGEAANSWMRNARMWSAPDVDRALAILLQADVSLKESSISSAQQILSSTILGLCAGGVEQNAA